MERLKIMVIDDHALFRAGLKMLLESQRDMEIIGEAESVEKGVQLARTFSPQLALIDISLKESDGFEATKQILKECPQIKVIMLTMYDSKEYLDKALQAGASGFVPKKAADIELIAA